MEFRVTSITEVGRGLGAALQVELENVQSGACQQPAENYEPTSFITATVPYDSEFYGLTIGAVLSFGIGPDHFWGRGLAPSVWTSDTKGASLTGSRPSPVDFIDDCSIKPAWTDTAAKLRAEMSSEQAALTVCDAATTELRKSLPVLLDLLKKGVIANDRVNTRELKEMVEGVFIGPEQAALTAEIEALENEAQTDRLLRTADDEITDQQIETSVDKFVETVAPKKKKSRKRK